MPRISTIPAQQVQEEIYSILEQPNYIRVSVQECTVAEETDAIVFSSTRPSQNFDILGDDYADLMSANPTWAPGKPAGTYRNEDLWHFIDQFRAGAMAESEGE